MNAEEPLSPALYLCATPIGNMEDITLRAIRVLGAVSAVYCEDTRRTGLLLSKLNIKKPLVSCREHNEAARAAQIVSRVRAGEAIAYVSDAGMPGVSDPGERLVRACIAANAPYTAVPGASAMPTALLLSGFPAANACFVGFLPRATKARRAALEAAALHRGTLVFYESPLRLADTAKELVEALGEREAALCREMTKLHEEIVRAPLSALARRYEETPPKGECVLVVASAPEEEAASHEDVREIAGELAASDMRARDAAAELAKRTGLSKNEAYALILACKNEG